MKNLMTGVLLATLSLLGATGCSSHCQSYCDHYKECLNADLDTGQCADRCEEANDNENHREKVEECSQCVESRTCAEAFSSCVDDCFGVQGP
ncbi:hypothetical protein [Hyalangium gracile]|uniref:hypothetical protein n=1 Tax=Hyalangium gracile TaxID=394092 RepID=UPI001CCCB309|nr:hypothetical protein [Hyalangium gracile]